MTDEEIRNNYLQYGHPDGKQSFSIGIALPQFIVTEGNGKYVLLVYGLLLGVLLPYVVGKWWYGSQKYTKDRVLVPSSGSLFRGYKPDLVDGAILSVLSSGDEFNQMLKGDKAHHGLAKLEKKLQDAGCLSKKDQQQLNSLDNASRRKALTLIWAYLQRIDLEDTTLNNGMK